MDNHKILITGANGQVGSVLSAALREKHGIDNVIHTDISAPESEIGHFEFLNVIDTDSMRELIETYEIKEIYHLAAILSANGERNPRVTWNVNFTSYLNLLELSLELGVQKIFFPSTIAVFGPTTPREHTPQDVPLLPSTVYGMSKASGEYWNQYYYDQYRLDIRSIRYPGIIGHQSMPGGGTTDYAVEIFHDAISKGSYECYLGPDVRLPMIFMDDAIQATMELMSAPRENVRLHYGYNIHGLDFTPAELAHEIQKHLPDFKITYAPDERENIAATWPMSIDDSQARADWDWQARYDLEALVSTMIHHLS